MNLCYKFLIIWLLLVYWIASLEDRTLRPNSLVNGSFNGGWGDKNNLEQGGRESYVVAIGK